MPEDSLSGTETTKVFISYSRRDRRTVTRLADALADTPGVEVFRDTEDILPTEEWKGRLEDLIAQADTVVFFLSPHSARSEVCRWEVAESEALNKRIAPVVISEVEPSDIPPALTKYNYIFCTGRRDYDKALASLVAALNTDIDWIREHTRLGALASRWETGGKPSELLLRGGELKKAEAWLAARPATAPQATSLHHGWIAQSRRGETARQRFWLTGAACVAAMAIALAAWSEINRQRAVAARERVERVLEQTTQATKDLVVGIADRYAAHPGIPRAMIIQILQQSRKLVAGLDAVGESRPDLLRNGGLALAELSRALLRQGDRESALETARATVDVFERLHGAGPGESAWVSGLVVGYDRLGDVHLDLGQIEEAERAYARALALAAELPKAELRTRLTGVAHENLGSVRQAQGRLEDALKEFKKALTLRKSLPRARSDVELQRTVSVSYEKIGDVQTQLQKGKAALASYQEGLRLARQIAEGEPDNVRWQEDLATAHRKVGDAHWSLGRSSEAVVHFRANLKIAETLHRADPEWRPWRTSLLVSHERLATASYRLGERQAAVDHFETALAHAKAILLTDPASIDALETVSRLYQSLSLSLFEAGRNADALARAEDALSTVKASAADLEETPRMLAGLHNNVAWFALFASQFTKALEQARAAVRLAPDSTLYLPNQAHALMFLGQRREARELYDRLMAGRGAGETNWLDAIASDFALLRKAGLEHALMNDIEAALGADLKGTE